MKREESEGRSAKSISFPSHTLHFYSLVLTKALASNVDGCKLRTVLDGQKRAIHELTGYNKTVSVNVDGLEEREVMNDEALGEEEATLLDVKRMEVDERGQIHHHQLLKVSCSLRNCQGFNRGGSVIQRGKGKRGLAVAQRSSLLEYRRQNSRVLRYQLGHVTE